MTRTNKTHCTFAVFLETVEPELRPICEALREMIIGLHPKSVEIVWQRQQIASYGIGPKKMSEHYAYIAPQRSHVNLGFYRGALLNDPGKLLEGTGKALRHIKVTNANIVNSPEFKHFVRQAVSERLAARK